MPSRAASRYGSCIVQLQGSVRHGRTAAMALAGILVAGGCAAFEEKPLAVVPPQERTPGARPGIEQRIEPTRPRATRATATPRPTPRARPTPLRTPRPHVTPMAEATASRSTAVEATLDPAPLASPASATPKATKPPATPRVHMVRLRPRPRPGPYRMDLYRPGDFSHQGTKDWCVAGSTQTMMNIMRRGPNDHSLASQRSIYLRGRQLSPVKRKLSPIGVDLIGWAALLERGGFGHYVVDGAGNRRAAIRKAARALRVTGRPVGLVTWRGAHSWVMSGFTATADPAWDADFEVQGVYIEDTWYPYVSTIWGASRPPDSLVPVAALAPDYLPYRRPLARWPARDGRFMLILPTLPPNTEVR
jgi:hypothetical protein